jgi:hypothetical protein
MLAETVGGGIAIEASHPSRVGARRSPFFGAVRCVDDEDADRIRTEIHPENIILT